MLICRTDQVYGHVVKTDDGLHETVSVRDFGLDNITEVDGLVPMWWQML